MQNKEQEKQENLFDHGKSSQANIVAPSIKQIKNYFLKHGIDENFKNIFLLELQRCFAKIYEFEKCPVWVKDREDYRMRSEIVVFVSFFDNLELDHYLTDEEDVIITNLYKSVREMGKERGWNMQILHLQFMKAMGNQLTNYITTVVLPRTLDTIDYN